MRVIVAVTLGFSGEPKLSIVSAPEFPTEAACVKATHVRGDFDSEHADQGNLAFSFCVRKDSVQIGPSSWARSDDAPSDKKSEP